MINKNYDKYDKNYRIHINTLWNELFYLKSLNK